MPRCGSWLAFGKSFVFFASLQGLVGNPFSVRGSEHAQEELIKHYLEIAGLDLLFFGNSQTFGAILMRTQKAYVRASSQFP